MNKLIILTGPSCIGKSPLEKALSRFYPEVRKTLHKLVLYNDRAPRPGEEDGVDYYFRTTDQLKFLENNPDYIFMDVRGDLQALDLNELQKILESKNAFFEGNPYVAEAMQNHPKLKKIPKMSVFLSPLSKDELLELKDPEKHVNLEEFVIQVMRRKQIRRKTRQRLEITFNDLQDVEKRAGSTFKELKMAWNFDYIIPNHDGEDSDNWEMFYYPLGDARKTLQAFVELLQGKVTVLAEKWDKTMF
jgi:guanylate kinase